MKQFTYTTKGTCSRAIEVTVNDDNIIESVKFIGGCSGNTQGVAALVKGMSVEEAISRLDGIKCGPRPTSCPDQLANALSCAPKELAKKEEEQA